MKKHKKKQTFGLFALITSLCVLVFPALAVKEPPYEVMRKDDNFEIRKYSPYIIAEIIVDGPFAEAGNKGFRPLFKYISGNNRSKKSIEMTAPVTMTKADDSIKIDMTAPVLQETTENGSFRVAFVMPEDFSMESTPEPLDSKVKIRLVPERLVAVHQYTGRWTKKKYDKKLGELEKWITKNEYKSVGEPILARYNPPFTPAIFRRNEVQFEVTTQETQSDQK